MPHSGAIGVMIMASVNWKSSEDLAANAASSAPHVGSLHAF